MLWRLGDWRPVGALGLCLLAGCSSVPQPYSRGQAIPLGPYTVRVSYVSMKMFQRVSSLAVYLHIPEVRTSDDATRLAARFVGRLVLRDGAGHKSLGVLMPAKQFDLAGMDPQELGSAGGARIVEDLLSSGDPTQWVALFPVSPQAQGFTLLIATPDRREGQPSRVSVDLGR